MAPVHVRQLGAGALCTQGSPARKDVVVEGGAQTARSGGGVGLRAPAVAVAGLLQPQQQAGGTCSGTPVPNGPHSLRFSLSRLTAEQLASASLEQHSQPKASGASAAAGRGRSATPPLAAESAAAQPTAAAGGGAEPTAPPPLLCELADYLAAAQREAEGRGEDEEVGSDARGGSCGCMALLQSGLQCLRPVALKPRRC